MPDNQSKFYRFWQELKRRKVLRSLTIYAGSAYIIFEAATLIFPRWGLPDWTIDLVLYLLILGAFINIVIAWIFDITPEGVQKTKPVAEVLESEKTTDSNAWKIATYISLAVIVGLIVLNIIPRNSLSMGKALLDKSIAVLPFINDSSEEENTYFINGIMESILHNLCLVEDLSVRDRTSVEQYRNNRKPVPEIAKEMSVSYVLEGSGQKIGNRIVLTLQLIDGRKGYHIWSRQYDRKIQKVEDLIDIQSEVAQLVAAEIEAIITPEEKQLIEKIPTLSLTAYDFYQQGREEEEKYYRSGYRDKKVIERAGELYYKTLEYDSTFAKAYVGLGWVYYGQHYWDTYYEEAFLDSMLTLANIALSFDDQLDEAYELKGTYYLENNNNALALNEFDQAIKVNPNYFWAYEKKGRLYMNDDLIKAIDNYQKAASLHRGSRLPWLYSRISRAYTHAGFQDKSIHYAKEALKLNDDSAGYYQVIAGMEYLFGSYEKAVEYGIKSYTIDSTRFRTIYFLGTTHSFLGQFEESLKYMKKCEENIKSFRNPDAVWFYQIGYAYWVNGSEEKADDYFNTSLKQINRLIDLDRNDFSTYLYLATIYTFLGDKEEAYENLRLLNKKPRMPLWMVAFLKDDPILDCIRDEPEFQQIVGDIEAKYQAEHERVRRWLEENEML